MAKIFYALYKTSEEERSINLNELTQKNYREKYRGRLHCATAGCPAKISYANCTGKQSYLKTWRGMEHAPHCIHDSTRIFERASTSGTVTRYAPLSITQMSKSMKEAYLREKMSDEERELLLDQSRINTGQKKRSKTTQRNLQLSLTLAIDPADKEIMDLEAKARLLKRTIDSLTWKDLTQSRTVIGEFEEADFSTERPVIRVKKNGIYANLLFEEAFFSESSSIRERLPLVLQYVKMYDAPIVVVVGQVRENKKVGEFEVAVFDPIAFSIDGQTLDMLAVERSVQQLSF